VWSSKDKTATHSTLPAESKSGSKEKAPAPSATELPKTPQEAAQMALAAIDPTTAVSTSGASVVAGQSAYDLVLKPKDTASLVAQVRISIDATHHVPLRVQVYSTKTANPAFEVGFTQVDFAKPAARQFAFNAPPGTKVTQSTFGAGQTDKAGATKPSAADQPRVVGTGWTAVVIAKMPTQASTGGATAKGDRQGTAAQLQGMLSLLPKTSGAWGSGRLLSGTLFSAVITDDGRVAIGAVSPQRLYAALAAK
jgi:hypothetical protein